MKSLVAVFFIIGLCSLVVNCDQKAATPNPVTVDSTKIGVPLEMAIKRGLDQLPFLVDEANDSLLGLSSPEVAKQLKTGLQFSAMMIGEENMRRYIPGEDSQLVFDAAKIYIPLELEGKAVLALVLARLGEGWQIYSFGMTHSLIAMVEQRTKISEKESIKASELSVIEIPTMNIMFLSFWRDNRLVLYPIFDYKTFELQAGQSINAEQLVQTYKEYQKKQSEMPRLPTAGAEQEKYKLPRGERPSSNPNSAK